MSSGSTVTSTATIYTLNLPEELAAHAGATGDLTRLCGKAVLHVD